MKLRSIFLAAAIAMTPLAGYAASQLSDFQLADRIKAKIESGKPLDIYVSYHDVSNEFAPFIKSGVQKAGGGRQGGCGFHRPHGGQRRQPDQRDRDADGQDGRVGDIVGLERRARAGHRSRPEGGHPRRDLQHRQSQQQEARLRRSGPGPVGARGRQVDGQGARRQRQGA